METLQAGFQYWQKGGWLLVPIAGVCLFIWYYLLEMTRQLGQLDLPAGSEELGLENRLSDKKKWAGLQAELLENSGIWSQAVVYVLQKVRQQADLFEIVDEVRSRMMSPYEGKLIVLGALVTSAPLLGLLGTIFGMVETFQAISDQTGNTTEIMASGISQGLITTQFGLIIAIPGIFGIAAIKKKLRQVDVKFAGLKNHLAFALRGDRP
ncbi:MotA/TolQ/ExbB proton channel family protein [bacterium]|nr:MotA/TolQ/ExbB proton channel family protein [bacterium]